MFIIDGSWKKNVLVVFHWQRLAYIIICLSLQQLLNTSTKLVIKEYMIWSEQKCEYKKKKGKKKGVIWRRYQGVLIGRHVAGSTCWPDLDRQIRQSTGVCHLSYQGEIGGRSQDWRAVETAKRVWQTRKVSRKVAAVNFILTKITIQCTHWWRDSDRLLNL